MSLPPQLCEWWMPDGLVVERAMVGWWQEFKQHVQGIVNAGETLEDSSVKDGRIASLVDCAQQFFTFYGARSSVAVLSTSPAVPLCNILSISELINASLPRCSNALLLRHLSSSSLNDYSVSINPSLSAIVRQHATIKTNNLSVGVIIGHLQFRCLSSTIRLPSSFRHHHPHHHPFLHFRDHTGVIPCVFNHPLPLSWMRSNAIMMCFSWQFIPVMTTSSVVHCSSSTTDASPADLVTWVLEIEIDGCVILDTDLLYTTSLLSDHPASSYPLYSSLDLTPYISVHEARKQDKLPPSSYTAANMTVTQSKTATFNLVAKVSALSPLLSTRPLAQAQFRSCGGNETTASDFYYFIKLMDDAPLLASTTVVVTGQYALDTYACLRCGAAIALTVCPKVITKASGACVILAARRSTVHVVHQHAYEQFLSQRISEEDPIIVDTENDGMDDQLMLDERVDTICMRNNETPIIHHSLSSQHRRCHSRTVSYQGTITGWIQCGVFMIDGDTTSSSYASLFQMNSNASVIYLILSEWDSLLYTLGPLGARLGAIVQINNAHVVTFGSKIFGLVCCSLYSSIEIIKFSKCKFKLSELSIQGSDDENCKQKVLSVSHRHHPYYIMCKPDSVYLDQVPSLQSDANSSSGDAAAVVCRLGVRQFLLFLEILLTSFEKILLNIRSKFNNSESVNTVDVNPQFVYRLLIEVYGTAHVVKYFKLRIDPFTSFPNHLIECDIGRETNDIRMTMVTLNDLMNGNLNTIAYEMMDDIVSFNGRNYGQTVGITKRYCSRSSRHSDSDDPPSGILFIAMVGLDNNSYDVIVEDGSGVVFRIESPDVTPQHIGGVFLFSVFEVVVEYYSTNPTWAMSSVNGADTDTAQDFERLQNVYNPKLNQTLESPRINSKFIRLCFNLNSRNLNINTANSAIKSNSECKSSIPPTSRLVEKYPFIKDIAPLDLRYFRSIVSRYSIIINVKSVGAIMDFNSKYTEIPDLIGNNTSKSDRINKIKVLHIEAVLYFAERFSDVTIANTASTLKFHSSSSVILELVYPCFVFHRTLEIGKFYKFSGVISKPLLKWFIADAVVTIEWMSDFQVSSQLSSIGLLSENINLVPLHHHIPLTVKYAQSNVDTLSASLFSVIGIVREKKYNIDLKAGQYNKECKEVMLFLADSEDPSYSCDTESTLMFVIKADLLQNSIRPSETGLVVGATVTMHGVMFRRNNSNLWYISHTSKFIIIVHPCSFTCFKKLYYGDYSTKSNINSISNNNNNNTNKDSSMTNDVFTDKYVNNRISFFQAWKIRSDDSRSAIDRLSINKTKIYSTRCSILYIKSLILQKKCLNCHSLMIEIRSDVTSFCPNHEKSIDCKQTLGYVESECSLFCKDGTFPADVVLENGDLVSLVLTLTGVCRGRSGYDILSKFKYWINKIGYLEYHNSQSRVDYDGTVSFSVCEVHRLFYDQIAAINLNLAAVPIILYYRLHNDNNYQNNNNRQLSAPILFATTCEKVSIRREIYSLVNLLEASFKLSSETPQGVPTTTAP